MPGVSPQHYSHDYSHENEDCDFDHSNGNGSETVPTNNQFELQAAHDHCAQLEDRSRRMQDIAHDANARLLAASEELIASEHNKKKMKEEYEQIIKGYQDKMGQMGLHIRTRDLQIMVVEDKYRRAQMELQNYHKKKHEIVEQAKKEEREAIKDRERATNDIRNMTGNAGSSNGDMSRRLSSGSLMARGLSHDRGAVGGGGRGAANGRRGVAPPDLPPEQRRKNCVEENLTEFFMI